MIIWAKLREIYDDEELKKIRMIKSEIDGGKNCIYEVLDSGALTRNQGEVTDDTEEPMI